MAEGNRAGMLNLQASLNRAGDVSRQNKAQEMARMFQKAQMAEGSRQFDVQQSRLQALLAEQHAGSVVKAYETLVGDMAQRGEKDPWGAALARIETTSPGSAKIIRQYFGDNPMQPMAEEEEEQPGGGMAFGRGFGSGFKQWVGKGGDIAGPVGALVATPIGIGAGLLRGIGAQTEAAGQGLYDYAKGVQSPIESARAERIRNKTKARNNNGPGDYTKPYPRVKQP